MFKVYPQGKIEMNNSCMYQIGKLSQLSGFTAGTIRFYERQGMLKSPSRKPNGYRLYSSEDLRQLKFILRGKQAGLSNSDMLQLMSLSQSRDQVACRDVRQVIDNKLEILRHQLDKLQQFEASLSYLSKLCCGGDESALHCSILEAFDDLMD